MSSNRRTNFDTVLYIRERCGNFDISPLCHVASSLLALYTLHVHVPLLQESSDRVISSAFHFSLEDQSGPN